MPGLSPRQPSVSPAKGSIQDRRMSVATPEGSAIRVSGFEFVKFRVSGFEYKGLRASFQVQGLDGSIRFRVYSFLL